MVRTLFGFIPCHLTSSPPSSGYIFVWLCPGVVVALLKYIYPEYNVGIARQLIFAMQAVCTCVFGYRRLHRFDGELKDTYADMECRDTTAVKHLLVAFCRHVGPVVVCQCRRQAGRLFQRAVLLSQFPQVCRHGARRVGCQDATLISPPSRLCPWGWWRQPVPFPFFSFCPTYLSCAIRFTPFMIYSPCCGMDGSLRPSIP